MSTMHDRMQTDYTWIRSHPTENPRQRVHGYNYIYNQAPNKFERLEMIYRSIGKQFDWELEKFRLSKKNIDRGNKRRFFKNAFRFIKNPAGYIYWKLFRLMEHNPRFIVLGMAAWVVLSIAHYKNLSDGVHRGNSILMRSGKNIEGTPGQYLGFYPKKPYLELFTIPMLLHYNISPRMIIMNQTWKQNLRKEFQLLKAYNIDY